MEGQNAKMAEMFPLWSQTEWILNEIDNYDFAHTNALKSLHKTQGVSTA